MEKFRNLLESTKEKTATKVLTDLTKHEIKFGRTEKGNEVILTVGDYKIYCTDKSITIKKKNKEVFYGEPKDYKLVRNYVK